MAIQFLFAIPVFAGLVFASPLQANAIIYQSGAELGRGIEHFGESISQSIDSITQKRNQYEAERRILLLSITNELIEKKKVSGLITEEDINIAALKYAIFCSCKKEKSLKIIRKIAEQI